MSKHPATRWSVALLLLAAASQPLSDTRWGSSLQLALLVGAIPMALLGISKDRERVAARARAERDAAP
ncbi:MAG: hypothetical protein ACRC50_02895 [Gaiella sp.]